MRKKIFSLIILTLAIVSLAFQGQFARRILPIFTDPATPCSPGSVYFNMLTDKFLICKSSGVEEVGSGISGGVFDFANSTTDGILRATDWVIFNSKQNALGFTPENLANKNASNGYAGLSGGKIALAQISEVQSILDLSDYAASSGSGVTAIKSTINAVALNDVLTWNGTNWVNLAPSISSIFGRTGIITAQSGDYSANQITNAFDTSIANTLINVITPSNPIAGRLIIWADSSDNILKAKDSSGTLSITIKPNTCTGTDKVSSITAAGSVICTADQTGGVGGGITSLNGLTAADQTFSTTDDSNIDIVITSITATHNFAISWVGVLAKSRMIATTVHTDQTNTFGNFIQIFQAGTNFRLVDPTNNTKVAQFDLSNISTATTRTINVPDANSTTIQSSTAPANQFANSISAQGVVGYAQPNFSNISGSVTDAQVPDSLSLTSIPNLTSNGFIKTSGGNGTLSIDTNTYLTVAAPIDATYITQTSNATLTNEQSLAALATGILKNTTTTGVLSIAIAGTDYLTPTGNGSGLTGLLFSQLGGSATDAQIPNNITIDLATVATTANSGDSATAFFSSGIIEVARLGTGTPSASNFLRGDGTWAIPAGGSGDMILASIQTVTGAKTFDPTKLVIGSVSIDPAVVIGSFYRDTDDGKLYFGVDDTVDFWGEIFIGGQSLINLASNVTGDLPFANLTPATAASKLLGRGDSGAGDFQEITIGSGLTMTGTTLSATGGGSGTVSSATIGQVAFYTGTTTVSGDTGFLYDTTTDSVSIGGNLTVNGGAITNNIVQNSQSAAYTTVLADAGKHIYHPSADTTARTWTIAANSSVAYPVGTAITFVNDCSAGVITISITTDTLVLAGAGTTGNRTLAACGVATAIKVSTTRWIINGTGLT